MYRVRIENIKSFEVASAIQSFVNGATESVSFVELSGSSLTRSTFSLVVTDAGSYLATYDFELKRWYRYSDGCRVKGTVSDFYPLSGVEWIQGPIKTPGTFIIQEVTGRYSMAISVNDTVTYYASKRLLRSKVDRYVSVSTLLPGKWKDV